MEEASVQGEKKGRKPKRGKTDDHKKRGSTKKPQRGNLVRRWRKKEEKRGFFEAFLPKGEP